MQKRTLQQNSKQVKGHARQGRGQVGAECPKIFGRCPWRGDFFGFSRIHTLPIKILIIPLSSVSQGCIFRLTCSHPELTEDHVLTSAYLKIFRTVTRNAVNKSVWRKKDCFWLPFNKHAMNIWLSSLRIRAHLSWRTGKHLHVLHVLRTYSTRSYPWY